MGKGADRKMATWIAKAERGTASGRDLRALAKQAGAILSPTHQKGRRHDNVVHEGLIIAQIPRHRSVSVGVQKALVLALRTAGLIGALALLVWMYLAWVS